MTQSRDDIIKKRREKYHAKRSDPVYIKNYNEKQRIKYNTDENYKNLKNEKKRIKRAIDSDYRTKDNEKMRIIYSSNWKRSTINKTKALSKRKNLDHNITEEFINDLWDYQNGKCFWFGFDLLDHLDGMNPLQPTLDRIDNMKGYTEDNVILTCLAANLGRNITDVVTFIKCLQKTNLSESKYDINIKDIKENPNVLAIRHKVNWAGRLKRESLRNSKNKNIKYNLTKEFIDDLNERQNGLCYWYGIKMETSIKPKYPLQHSLDRIDSKGGYTQDNVVLCTLMANHGKNKTDPQKWLKFSEMIKMKIENNSIVYI
jgi:hypothetical protein